MIEVKTTICDKTIREVEKILKSRDLPIKMFSKMIEAAKELDFSAISDPIIKNRYNESKIKITEYFNRVIRLSVYETTSDDSSDDMYNEFINLLITLFAIFDTIIQGRLYISDIAKQDSTILAEFLDNYGYTIHRIFEEDINKDFAKDIYGHVRKKGTTHLMTVLLNNMGYNCFQVNEYKLNRIDGKFALCPFKTYETESIKDSDVDVYPVYIEDLDDILWQLDDEDLSKIFEDSLRAIGG